MFGSSLLFEVASGGGEQKRNAYGGNEYSHSQEALSPIRLAFLCEQFRPEQYVRRVPKRVAAPERDAWAGSPHGFEAVKQDCEPRDQGDDPRND